MPHDDRAKATRRSPPATPFTAAEVEQIIAIVVCCLAFVASLWLRLHYDRADQFLLILIAVSAFVGGYGTRAITSPETRGPDGNE